MTDRSQKVAAEAMMEEPQRTSPWECAVCQSVHWDANGDDVVCHVCQAERP